MISHKYKCIFVHIPKTGGTSIENVLGDSADQPVSGGSAHDPITHYKEKYSEHFDQYFKFSIVRNPWDRTLSIFNYLSNGGNQSEVGLNIAKEIGNDFKKFCKNILVAEQCSTALTLHLRSQWQYLNLPAASKFDFIGRFETLEEDYENIAYKLGITAKLPHTRKTPHLPYWNYYDEECITIVQERYAKDVAQWEYKFERGQTSGIRYSQYYLREAISSLDKNRRHKLKASIRNRFPKLVRFMKRILRRSA